MIFNNEQGSNRGKSWSIEFQAGEMVSPVTGYSMVWIQNATGFSVDLPSEIPLQSQMPKRGSEVLRFFILDPIFTKNNFIYPILYISHFILLRANSINLCIFALKWKDLSVYISMTIHIGRHIKNFYSISPHSNDGWNKNSCI